MTSSSTRLCLNILGEGHISYCITLRGPDILSNVIGIGKIAFYQMNTIFVNISFFHYCQNIFCGRKKWLCGSIWPTGRSLKTPDIDYEEEWWQHTPLSGVYQHGERLWFNSTDCEQEYSYLTASKRWPSTPFSRNTPQSFSGGTRSCNFPRLTKHVYTSLECSQDFSKICWRVEFCSDVLRPWRTPHRYDPALVQLFRGIFLQSTWRTLFQEG